MNLLNVTIRYVKKNNESFLSYAKENSIAVVLYVNIPISTQGEKVAKRWVRELVNNAIRYQGTYYLPYQLWPTRAQLLKAYPKIKQFFVLKRKYDPQEILMNDFYQHYAKT